MAKNLTPSIFWFVLMFQIAYENLRALCGQISIKMVLQFLIYNIRKQDFRLYLRVVVCVCLGKRLNSVFTLPISFYYDPP